MFCYYLPARCTSRHRALSYRADPRTDMSVVLGYRLVPDWSNAYPGSDIKALMSPLSFLNAPEMWMKGPTPGHRRLLSLPLLSGYTCTHGMWCEVLPQDMHCNWQNSRSVSILKGFINVISFSITMAFRGESKLLPSPMQGWHCMCVWTVDVHCAFPLCV